MTRHRSLPLAIDTSTDDAMRLDPSTYRRHSLHAEGRDWVERNCAIDSWIEVLHAQDLDPMAMLPCTLAVDYQGDQWTFYKPSPSELWELYGMDVQELTVWQPLLDHVAFHVGAGRLIGTETDAFFLPDVRGTDYREHHTKTNIVIHAIDVKRRHLGYFHNAGSYELEGDDFDGVFRTGAAVDPNTLPLFAELIRTDRRKALSPESLRAISARLLACHMSRRPEQNPVAAFARSMDAEIERAQRNGLDWYHAYAFANIRQLGSAYELAALYLRWLQPPDGQALAGAADAFSNISATAKALILKGARAVHARRPLDAAPMLDRAACEWEWAMHEIDQTMAMAQVLAMAQVPARAARAGA